MLFQEFLAQTTKFIADKSGVQAAQIKPDTRLVESGVVDSLLLTELIVFVEDTLDCTIDIDDFRVAKFESIEAIYASYGQ
jgi:acyl carrier protein